MNDAMLSWGFKRLTCESCIYYRKSETGTGISAVHVDDFLSIASSKSENKMFKKQMKTICVTNFLPWCWHIAYMLVPTLFHMYVSLYMHFSFTFLFTLHMLSSFSTWGFIALPYVFLMTFIAAQWLCKHALYIQFTYVCLSTHLEAY